MLLALRAGIAVALLITVLARRSSRARRESPPGLPLGPDEAPGLWRAVGRIAGQVGARIPDEIRLVPDAAVALVRETRFFGLVRGPRRLLVGLPLLLTVGTDQLGAILAQVLRRDGRPAGELTVLATAWRFYLDSYVRFGAEFGYVPDDVFGGFREMVRHRAEELDRMRIAAGSRPEPPSAQPSADTLVTDLRAAAKALEPAVVDHTDRQVLPWPHLMVAVADARSRRDAEVLAQAAATLAGVPSAGLGTILDQVADGRLGELAVVVTAGAAEDPDEAVAYTLELFRAAFETAALRAGVAQWRHSWSGPVPLVDAEGRPLDFGELVSVAMTGRGGVAQARERLRGFGVVA